MFLWDNAQKRPRIDLDPFNACRAYVPSIVQRFIMLIVFDEHEGDGRHLSLYQMTLGTRIPVVISRDCRHLFRKDSESASASLSASLISFER